MSSPLPYDRVADALNREGETLFAAGKRQDATARFGRVLELDPENALAHNNLGVTLWQRGDRENAAKHLLRAVTLAPDNREFLGNAGRVLTVLGRGDSARELYGRYLREVGFDAEIAGLAAAEEPGIIDTVLLDNGPATAGKRLISIIDYSVQPYNIGDLIIYQFGSMMMARILGVERIDFCFISDPESPPTDPNIGRLISRENRYYNLFSIIPTIQLNPQLGAMYVLDSHAELDRFLAQNEEKYLYWPTLRQLRSQEYMFYSTFRMAREFHDRFGALPSLLFNDDLTAWARHVFSSRVYPALPVTVNLRNNPHFHHHRNSDIAAWLEFFQACHGRYDVKFIITCGIAEIDDRLRTCPNVIFAKDLHTNIVQDLALIHYAAFHMGSPSGPAALPVFEAKPYYIVNCDMLPHIDEYRGALLRTEEGKLRFAFAREAQHFGIGTESGALLLREFEMLLRAHASGEMGTEGLLQAEEPGRASVTWLA